jgi:uncharacterized SAM-binding protein YcdF (DUF218 family)
VFFYLSKTIAFLAMPLTLMAICWLGYLILKSGKWKKRALYAALSLSFLFTNNFLAQELMRWWEVPPTPIEEISGDYMVGVVLTGVALTDRELNDRVYFARGADRIVNALQLYKEGIIRKVLITGGTGRISDVGFPEAEALADFLRLAGVPSGDILLETKANNTYENALFTAEMLNELYPSEKILLLTSAFHMRRSAACFRKQNVDFDVYSGDFYTRGIRAYGFGDFLFPNADALLLWHKLFKEWIGMLTYKLAGYI